MDVGHVGPLETAFAEVAALDGDATLGETDVTRGVQQGLGQSEEGHPDASIIHDEEPSMLWQVGFSSGDPKHNKTSYGDENAGQEAPLASEAEGQKESAEQQCGS